jgi:hypothetical protein
MSPQATAEYAKKLKSMRKNPKNMMLKRVKYKLRPSDLNK